MKTLKMVHFLKNLKKKKTFLKVTLLVSINSVQSLSCVRLLSTLWIAAGQASLSITSSHSSLKLTSIESVMPSSHLILCRPLLLLPPIPPSISIFSNESTLRMRWPKYWSFSFTPEPSFRAQLQHHHFSQLLHDHSSPKINLGDYFISATPCLFCYTVGSLMS